MNSGPSSSVIATIPFGHECTAIDESHQWWEVKTEIDRVPLHGFINSNYLSPALHNPTIHDSVSKVHLRENRNEVTPSKDRYRANPIGDHNRPVRNQSSTSSKVESIHRIISYLDAEKSIRYKRKGSTTYCNVYAYDFCYLCEAYLPRVWWSGNALVQLSQGNEVPVRYGDTVFEIRANEIFQWLKDFGQTFGWRRVFTVQELQNSANNGGIGLIVANTKDHTRPGHIVAVVPQTDAHHPVVLEGQVTTPVMSQAGGTNYNYFSRKWWTKDKFSFFGFWIHT